MRHLRLPLVLLLAVAALAAAMAPSASASRPATAEEITAMTAALVQPAPAHCFRGAISTVDASWAALRPAAVPVGCPGADGVLILRLEDGTWTLVTGASGDSSSPCSDYDLPQRIAADLRLCTPVSRQVFAAVLDRFEVKPRDLPWGAHAFVDRIRWRSWGGKTAVGRGVLDYADRYDRFKIPVRVTLDRRSLCVDNRTYLSQRATAIRKRDARRIRYLRGPWELTCPNEWIEPN